MILIATILILALTLWLAVALHKIATRLEAKSKADEYRASRLRFEAAEREVYDAMACGDVVGLRQALDVYGEAAAKVE